MANEYDSMMDAKSEAFRLANLEADVQREEEMQYDLTRTPVVVDFMDINGEMQRTAFRQDWSASNALLAALPAERLAEMPRTQKPPATKELGWKERNRRRKSAKARVYEATENDPRDTVEFARVEAERITKKSEAFLKDSAGDMKAEKKEAIKKNRDFSWAADEAYMPEHLPMLTRVREIVKKPILAGHKPYSAQVMQDDFFRFAKEAAQINLHARALAKVIHEENKDLRSLRGSLENPGSLRLIDRSLEDDKLLREYNERVAALTLRMHRLEAGLGYLHGTGEALSAETMNALKLYGVDIAADKQKIAGEAAVYADNERAQEAARAAATEAIDWEDMADKISPNIKKIFTGSKNYVRSVKMMKPMTGDPGQDAAITEQNKQTLLHILWFDEDLRSHMGDMRISKEGYEKMLAFARPFAERLLAFDTERFKLPGGALDEEAIFAAQREIFALDYSMMFSDMLKATRKENGTNRLRDDLFPGDPARVQLLGKRINQISNLVDIARGLAMERAAAAGVFDENTMLNNDRDKTQFGGGQSQTDVRQKMRSILIFRRMINL